VLPFATEQACTASVDASPDPDLTTVRSAQQPAPVQVRTAQLEPGASDLPGWAAYVLGAAWALRRRGYPVPGLSIDVDSSVPIGAGLSSSAALVCAVTTAVDDLLELRLGPDELLAVTRAVENDFVGAPTGGMDQLAALRCTEGHALFCDMRTLETEPVPFDVAAAGLAVVVLDSRAPHAHADNAYGERRAGCERAAGLLGVPALRDLGAADLDDALPQLPDDTLRRYVRHVVTEDERVLRTVELLRAGRLAEIGPLLTDSHASMRDDYRITIAELDVAVDTFLDAGALGARMTGGGFGGCVIALLPAGQVEPAVAAVRREYDRHGFAEPAHFTARPAAGARRA
jgi:galactokinase